jgi:ribosomal-protein-serine acetyltransferase
VNESSSAGFVYPASTRGPRVELRTWSVGDVDAFAELVVRNLDHLGPWMPWVAFEPQSRSQRIDLIRGWSEAAAAGRDHTVGIFLDGVPIGGSGLHRRRGPGVLEIGYWIDHEHEGRGFVAESAAVLTDLAFTDPDIERVEIHHDGANARSGRVPHRLGFEFLGATPDQPQAPGDNGVDCVWAVTRSAWPGAESALARR